LTMGSTLAQDKLICAQFYARRSWRGGVEYFAAVDQLDAI